MARPKSKPDKWGFDALDQARSDYHMAKRSGAQKRFVRGIPSGGAGADYHYRNESSWLWMGELAWDLYRNNMALGSITDRAVENWLQDGFRYEPFTGDLKLDADLIDWWAEVCESPRECDISWENSFHEQTEIVARSTVVGGDIFALPSVEDENDPGTVALKEFHLCRSPSRKVSEYIVHGVQMDDATRRRRVNYWMLEEPIDPSRSVLKKQLKPFSAYYDDELTGQPEQNVFHVRFPKRSTQTRGITAYAPLFDVAGYHDDVQFLKLVQARAASLFVFVRKRAADFDPEFLAAESKIGADVSVDKSEIAEDVKRSFQQVAAGSELEGLPGESIEPWSANIPNPEFFPHAKLLLTFMGINLGMPLVMAMMDGSETNFSGYRGAVDQARMGFRRNQKRLIDRWHRPFMRFKLLKKAERDPVFRRFAERSMNPRTKINVFRHDWNPPSWPYIEPTKDATADLIRDSNMLTSPRRRCRERGDEFKDIASETVDDRSSAIQLALDALEATAKKYAPEAVKEVMATAVRSLSAHSFAPLPMPTGVNVSLTASADEPAPAPAPKPSQPNQ